MNTPTIESIAPVWQELAGHLNEQEQVELLQALAYLTQHTQDGTVPAEGSIGAILNRLSPNVRGVFATLSELTDSRKHLPFQETMEDGDYANSLGLDPQLFAKTKGIMDTEEVAGGLQQRMGTDASRPPEPPSLRDILRMATELHGGN
jgi:hypothetical protein